MFFYKGLVEPQPAEDLEIASGDAVLAFDELGRAFLDQGGGVGQAAEVAARA